MVSHVLGQTVIIGKFFKITSQPKSGTAKARLEVTRPPGCHRLHMPYRIGLVGLLTSNRFDIFDQGPMAPRYRVAWFCLVGKILVDV